MEKQTPEEILQHLNTIARVGVNKRVAEAKLRMACSAVAERIVVGVGEACSLPGGYRIVNLDPMSDLLDAPPRLAYLVLVEETKHRGHIRTLALSGVPNDAVDRFDFQPAGRLTLSKFAAKIQNGWHVDVLNKHAETTHRIEELAADVGRIASGS